MELLEDCEVETIKAKHTNESVLKCLSQLRKIKFGSGVKKIIALVSQKTLKDKDERFDNLTAFEYFKNVTSASFGFMPAFVEVNAKIPDNVRKEILEKTVPNVKDLRRSLIK